MHGVPLSAPGSVDRIRQRMGVCPQADILWPELTGKEHLHLYGAIKACEICSSSMNRVHRIAGP